MMLFRLWRARRLLKRSRWHMREADRLMTQAEKLVASTGPRVVRKEEMPMFDLHELIDAFLKALAAWEAAVGRGAEDDCPEWAAYEAAEHLIVTYPCRTLEEVWMKPRFFMENAGPYDTIRNCYTTTEETLLTFLRSLLGEERASPFDEGVDG